MAILFNATSEALARTSGTFLSNASNWTVAFWRQIVTNTPTAGRYRVLWDLLNVGGVGYAFVGCNDANRITLYCANGIDPDQTFNGPVLTIGQWYYITVTYDATTKVFTEYLDGVLVNTLTMNLSTITFTQQYLSDDGTPGWSNDVVEYYRDWQRKLTTAQILAEKSAYTAALATNLFTDTPLVATGTLTDLSGNGHTWTAVGAISYTSPGALPPANDYSTTAIDITSLLPYVPAVVNAQDADTSTGGGGIWYKYTAQAGDSVIGFWAFGGLGAYIPTTRVFQADAATPWLDIAASNVPVQFPVVIGTTYYIQAFVPGGNIVPATMTVNVLRAPAATVPIGSFGINDDTGRFPLALLDQTTALPLRFINTIAVGEAAVVFVTGTFGATDNTLLLPPVFKVYNPQYALTVTVTDPFGGSTILNGLTTDLSSRFYLSGTGTARILALASTGALVRSWTVGLTAPTALGVQQDNSVLYYATVASAVKRWDLVNDLALSDLAAAVGGTFPVRDILALADGTIIVAYPSTGVAPKTLVIRHYSAAGAILNTISHADVGGDTRLCMAIDDPNSFWLWTKLLGANNGFSQIENIKASNGTVLSTRTAVQYEAGTYQGAQTATPTRFGHSESCPIWIVRAVVTPSGSLPCVSIASAAADPAGAPIGGSGPYGESVTAIAGCLTAIAAAASDPAGGPIGGTSPYGIF